VVLVAPVTLETTSICACVSTVDGAVAVPVVDAADVAVESAGAPDTGSCEPPLHPAVDAATHSVRKIVRMPILKAETAEPLVDEAEAAQCPCVLLKTFQKHRQSGHK
jgi:hypothetical protein